MEAVDDYTTVPKAAKKIGMGPKALHEILDRGAIPFIVPNKQRRVKLSDVEFYRNRRTHGRRAQVARVPGDDPLAD